MVNSLYSSPAINLNSGNNSYSIGNGGLTGTATDVTGGGATAPVTSGTKPVTTFLIVLGILILLKFAIEHEKARSNPAVMGIGVWNFVAVTLMATLGIVTEKVIFNRYYVPGVSEFFSAA